ncbi:hypothetical protein WMY93_016625 [Mugilogobius chulae]|uniref:Testicular haploid expressed gene protein-like n=1 Tax=Mugilogobius chulae TaxID=88201 RepID=A0AAW0NM20_9GOBI
MSATQRCHCSHRKLLKIILCHFLQGFLCFLLQTGLDSMAKRIQQLAQPKPNRLRYPDRLNPEWKVSEWALKAVPSQRLCRLALPRLPAAEWQPERPLLGPLSRATQTTVATARICRLAQPKKKHQQDVPAPKPKPVPLSSGSSRASAHIELLAVTPKHNHPKFEGEREVCWPVSRSAQKAVASPRLQELSNPKERKALYEGFNPYIISRAARSACPSARIRQLSLPLPRKCSSQ